MWFSWQINLLLLLLLLLICVSYSLASHETSHTEIKQRRLFTGLKTCTKWRQWTELNWNPYKANRTEVNWTAACQCSLVHFCARNKTAFVLSTCQLLRSFRIRHSQSLTTVNTFKAKTCTKTCTSRTSHSSANRLLVSMTAKAKPASPWGRLVRWVFGDQMQRRLSGFLTFSKLYFIIA